MRMRPTGRGAVSRSGRRLPALALAALASLAAVPCAHALEAGDRAPAFELTGPQGEVRLADAAGKLIYLDFWASWCGPCRHSFPWMSELQAKYRGEGLQIIAVNLDSRREDAESFLAAMPPHFAVAFDPDGTLPRQYGVKGMPTSLLIGRDGKVLAQHVGFTDSGRKLLEQEIAAALAGPH